jgi:hypothetical protein
VVGLDLEEALPRWFTFDNLFAFCDLHASRWASWPQDPGYRPQYFDRQGFPIPGDQGAEWIGSATQKWAALMTDKNYMVVAQDDLPDGSLLSTCWLGLDHAWSGPPLFFETMRFGKDIMVTLRPYLPGNEVQSRETLDFPDIFGEPGAEISQDRYGSEEEALAAHHEIVRRIRLREGH